MKIRIPFILSAMLVPAALVHGQTAPPTVSTTLPTVVVTGENQPQSSGSVTELPIPAVQSAETPELQDLSGRAPNFFVSRASEHSFGDIYAIRGLGNTIFFSSPAVGLYVDDLPYGDAYTFLAPLYNFDRVDIFRGPQGANFGLNSEAGLIALHTQQSSAQEWHGEATGSYGSYNTQEYRLSLSGPLIKDKLTISLSGYSGLSDGFVTNTLLHRTTDTRDTLAGRLQLTWTPLPDWKISAGVEGGRVDDGSERIVPLGANPYQVASGLGGFTHIHEGREWFEIEKKFETWEVKSITTHSEWALDPNRLDLSLSPASPTVSGLFPSSIVPGELSNIHRTQSGWSEELRFQSLPVEPPAPATDDKATDGKDGKQVAIVPPENHFHWRAGFFFQDNVTTGDDLRNYSVPVESFGPFSYFLPVNARTTYTQTENNYAVYLNGGYNFGNLDLDGGVRADYTEKFFDRAESSVLNTSLLNPGGVIRFGGNYDQWTAAPSLGLTFHLTKEIDLFARSSYGFKPGGFSAFTDDPKLAGYKRETVWASEAGVRLKALNDKLHAQLTGYYDSIHNYQVEQTFSFTDYLVANAPHATSYGVEFEASWELAHGLTLSGNIGYNQTTLDSYHDPITGANLSGNIPPFVPQYTALAALDYACDCGLRFHLDYVGVGATNYQATDLPIYRQGAYALLNARVGYEYRNYGVYLFGRNLTDKAYYTQISPDIDAGVIGERRILGVMAQLKF